MCSLSLLFSHPVTGRHEDNNGINASYYECHQSHHRQWDVPKVHKPVKHILSDRATCAAGCMCAHKKRLCICSASGCYIIKDCKLSLYASLRAPTVVFHRSTIDELLLFQAYPTVLAHLSVVREGFILLSVKPRSSDHNDAIYTGSMPCWRCEVPGRPASAGHLAIEIHRSDVLGPSPGWLCKHTMIPATTQTR